MKTTNFITFLAVCSNIACVFFLILLTDLNSQLRNSLAQVSQTLTYQQVTYSEELESLRLELNTCELKLQTMAPEFYEQWDVK